MTFVTQCLLLKHLSVSAKILFQTQFNLKWLKFQQFQGYKKLQKMTFVNSV